MAASQKSPERKRDDPWVFDLDVVRGRPSKDGRPFYDLESMIRATCGSRNVDCTGFEMVGEIRYRNGYVEKFNREYRFVSMLDNAVGTSQMRWSAQFKAVAIDGRAPDFTASPWRLVLTEFTRDVDGNERFDVAIDAAEHMTLVLADSTTFVFKTGTVSELLQHIDVEEFEFAFRRRV